LDLNQLFGYSVEGLNAGDYDFVVIDENGCVSQADLSITQPNALEVTSVLDTDFVEIIVDGGTSPYEYVWSVPEITGNSATLEPGVYNVTVTDSNGCETSIELTVPVGVDEISNAPLSYTMLNNQIVFNNTMFQINIYELGGKIVHTANSLNRIDVSALAQGIYLISAVDSSSRMRIAKIVIQN
jgi:Secretion system C-terminal sorting domain